MLKLSSRNSDGDVARQKSAPVKGRRYRELFELPGFFLGVILVLVVGLVFWASIATVDKVVRVEGKIIPAGRSQQIQHLEGGIIASIDTKEGASVKKGDLLLTINNTTADADLGEASVKLNSERLRAIRLQAEVANKNAPGFPPDLAKLPEAEAERNLFEADRAKLAQEIAVHQDTIRQHEAEIADAEQRRAKLTAEQATAHQRLAMIENMAAQGAASKLEMLDAQSREQQLNTEIEEAAGAIPKLKAAIAEEQSRIDAIRAEFRTQAQNDLVTALAEADRLKQIATAAADRVKRTEIRSPIDGVINRIAVNTVGGVIRPGEDLIEIIPRTDQVLIEARASPRDRGYLRPGLKAQIRVSAYDTEEFGILNGRVTEVSADSMQEPRGGEPYFQVNILVSSIPPSYAGKAMIPGMTVTADIVTGRRTVLGYLLSPVDEFTHNMFRDPR